MLRRMCNTLAPQKRRSPSGTADSHCHMSAPTRHLSMRGSGPHIFLLVQLCDSLDAMMNDAHRLTTCAVFGSRANRSYLSIIIYAGQVQHDEPTQLDVHFPPSPLPPSTIQLHALSAPTRTIRVAKSESRSHERCVNVSRRVFASADPHSRVVWK